MYAIIEVGAKQYSVKKVDTIEVEKQDVPEGKSFSLDRVLLVSEKEKVLVGSPYIPGAKVNVEVLGNLKAGKAVSFKYRRRKSSHWKKGHRQQLTRLKIKAIEVG